MFTATVFLGFLLILGAGVSDGSFYLPSKYTRKWEWEHYWAIFTLSFLVISWILTFIFIPNIFRVYSATATRDLYMILAFGALWGVGAILFGTANYLLGMALAYPLGLGTVACVGSLIPLMTTERENLFTFKGLLVIVGTSVAMGGIVVCSRAFKAKEDAVGKPSVGRSVPLVVGLLVAIFAGVFSALINIALSFAENVIDAARGLGVSKIPSAIAPWPLFFSVASVVNFGYCLFLMVKHDTLKDLWGRDITRNFPLGIAMGALFVCAVYAYSMGATCLGSWGEVPGWIMFMSVDIITGNTWGLWTGEWDAASKKARSLLKSGMAIILIAIVVAALSQAMGRGK